MTEFGAIFGEKRIVDWRDETKSKFGGISGMQERSEESPERIENWMIKISTIFVIPEIVPIIDIDESIRAVCGVWRGVEECRV